MQEWIPVSTSPKGRLALAAVREFGLHPFDEVTVGELATAARVTTGAIYHHFESKLGLYEFVRSDVERRLLDRMEGALAAATEAGSGHALATALLVGFDFAVQEGFLQLLAAPPPGSGPDLLTALLAVGAGEAAEGAGPAGVAPLTGVLLAAAWRAALAAVAGGADPADARTALAALAPAH